MTEISVGFTIVIPRSVDPGMHFSLEVKRLSASLLLNISLSFEVGIAHAIANFK